MHTITSNVRYKNSVKRSLDWEFLRATALKLALAILSGFWLPTGSSIDNWSDFADSMSGFAGVLAGFLISAMALTYSLTTSDVFIRLRELGHLRVLQVESVIAAVGLIIGAVLFATVRLYPEMALMQFACAVSFSGALFLIDLCRKYQMVLQASFEKPKS
jgi:hypothetical protein